MHLVLPVPPGMRTGRREPDDGRDAQRGEAVCHRHRARSCGRFGESAGRDLFGELPHVAGDPPVGQIVVRTGQSGRRTDPQGRGATPELVGVDHRILGCPLRVPGRAVHVAGVGESGDERHVAQQQLPGGRRGVGASRVGAHRPVEPRVVLGDPEHGSTRHRDPRDPARASRAGSSPVRVLEGGGQLRGQKGLPPQGP